MHSFSNCLPKNGSDSKIKQVKYLIYKHSFIKLFQPGSSTEGIEVSLSIGPVQAVHKNNIVTGQKMIPAKGEKYLSQFKLFSMETIA